MEGRVGVREGRVYINKEGVFSFEQGVFALVTDARESAANHERIARVGHDRVHLLDARCDALLVLEGAREPVVELLRSGKECVCACVSR